MTCVDDRIRILNGEHIGRPIRFDALRTAMQLRGHAAGAAGPEGEAAGLKRYCVFSFDSSAGADAAAGVAAGFFDFACLSAS